MSKNVVSVEEFQRIANRVSVITIIENFILTILKLLVGLYSHSTAVLSDAIHSASDVFSTIIVMIGIKLSSKESDKDHQYGHERFECIAALILSLILSLILFGTGLKIGISAIQTILSGIYTTNATIGFSALIITIISIITKELMYWYTRHYALKIDSNALMADAWHHRSDSLSSIGALIGVIGCMLGYPIMDSLASLVIFFFIAKAAYDIFNGLVK